MDDIASEVRITSAAIMDAVPAIPLEVWNAFLAIGAAGLLILYGQGFFMARGALCLGARYYDCAGVIAFTKRMSLSRGLVISFPQHLWEIEHTSPAKS